MDIEVVVESLNAAYVSFWLDVGGHLRVDSEPVLLDFVRAMQRAPAATWDRLLKALHWSPSGAIRAESQAATSNQILHEPGVIGQPGHITTATVEHGEKQRKNDIRPEVGLE